MLLTLKMFATATKNLLEEVDQVKAGLKAEASGLHVNHPVFISFSSFQLPVVLEAKFILP